MTQLRFDLFERDSDNYFLLRCSTCSPEPRPDDEEWHPNNDKMKFYREMGLTKMFGWDERLGYSCEGCGDVYFISNIDIYHGIKSGFLYTLWELWHPAEVQVWQWNTDFFDGGDIWYPVDRENFEEQCRKHVAESDEISLRIKETYG